MTITNTTGYESTNIKTKTEVHVHSDYLCTFSRIIDSEICTYELKSEKPISVRLISNFSKIPDELFKQMCVDD